MFLLFQERLREAGHPYDGINASKPCRMQSEKNTVFVYRLHKDQLFLTSCCIGQIMDS